MLTKRKTDFDKINRVMCKHGDELSLLVQNLKNSIDEMKSIREKQTKIFQATRKERLFQRRSEKIHIIK